MTMDANKAVLKYLKVQNRPYSANDICSNMHKEYGKSAIQKALDSLVAEDHVIEKTYGKQKVYAYNQTRESANFDANSSSDIDGDIERINSEVSKLEKEIKESEAKLSMVRASLTTADAERELSKITSEVERLRGELKDIKSNPETVSSAEREKIISTHAKYVKEWRTRKNQCMQMVLTILENLPKNKVSFMQELGMETDEDVNVSISDMKSMG
ncbi:hypothetical protein J437_LFUL005173 [Ladona fulva]|uniref:Homologous-pairing protein 2 homolog n=1 Tax=Ladona fulva TaxID=123851 RepID=A0A8K0P7T0_LADFU|nr:hypothetical protein J437_LFUL005173 [Ladona fulva]